MRGSDRRTEYRSLLSEAGFVIETVIRLNAPRDLIVAKRR
jgi:hypothetical protein